MRGKVFLAIVRAISFGITPAYAGKRENQAYRSIGVEDHPRLCGEKNGLNHILQRIEGSPPPMRGKEAV